MAIAETAELAVRLSLDDRVSRSIGTIERRLGAFSGAVNRNLGRAIDAGLTRGIRATFGFLEDGLESLKALELAQAQTQAVLESTGSVAGVTAEQVRRLAEQYEALNATIDDKVIQSAENVLLTFTNIREQAFEPALAAVLDFSQATGRDATEAARLLGKALNDPARGMIQLRRAGVSLNAETEEQIQTLAEQGRLYEAQKILLDELTIRYGGSFAKAGQTAAGTQARLLDVVEDLQRAFATKLLPAVERVSVRLTEYLGRPETIAFFERLGDVLGSLLTDENLDAAAFAIESAAKAVGGAISLFNQLPPEIKALAIGAFAINKVTGGAVGGAAEAFGKLVGAGLKQIFAAHVTVVGGSVTGSPGGVPGVVGKGGGGVKGALGGAARIILPAAAIAAAVEVSGVLDPRHQTASGQVFRGTNDAAEQIGHLERAISRLEERIAGGERGIAERQLAETKAALARLQASLRPPLDQIVASSHQSYVAQQAASTRTVDGLLALIGSSRAEIAATRASGQQAAAAIRDKKLSTTVNVTTSTQVTVRDMVTRTRSSARYGQAFAL